MAPPSKPAKSQACRSRLAVSKRLPTTLLLGGPIVRQADCFGVNSDSLDHDGINLPMQRNG